jgi:hypothetical protein
MTRIIRPVALAAMLVLTLEFGLRMHLGILQEMEK